MNTLVNAWKSSKTTRVVVIGLTLMVLCGCWAMLAAYRQNSSSDPIAQTGLATPNTIAEEREGVTPLPTRPTSTPSPPPPSLTPTHTPIPTADLGSCRPDAVFVADVTVPDDTTYQPGSRFIKTWRVRNTGSCTWSPAYQLTFRGGDPLGANESVDVPETAQGEEAELSVPLTAPDEPGRYRSDWQLCANQETCFGVRLYTQIVVVPPPTATPRPTAPPTTTPFPRTAGASRWLTHKGQRVGVKEIAWDTGLEYWKPEEGHIYLSLYIVGMNIGKYEETFSPSDFSVVDGGGEVTSGVWFGERHPSFDHCTVRPGGVCEGWWTTMIWNREEVRSDLTLRWSPSLFGPTLETRIDQQ